MTVIDLDGNISNWSLLGKIKNLRNNQSSLHKKTLELLKEIYPTIQILQEVSIPLRRHETLYLDFYLPMLKKAIEVHGEQHYKFVAHYHNNALGFIRHKKRDSDKKSWCDINNIEYIELPYNENIEQWKQRILNK
jgi:L-lactate utilization protein LutB